MNSALHSKASVEHYTPIDIIERVRATLGQIDLDPASCEFANRAVLAEQIYTGPPDSDGLITPWAGNVFTNPPGKSKANPKGAAAWWAKLMEEFSAVFRADRVRNAIFLGFSLELLQTAQSYPCAQPTDFLYCIPRRRIPFDVRTDELAQKLAAELPYICMDPRDYAKKEVRLSLTPVQRKKADKLLYCLDHPDQRVAGDSPTHGNIIVCVSEDHGVSSRFRRHFKSLGFVEEGSYF